MNRWADEISRFCSRSIDLLLIKYPTRTSLGIVLGLVLDFLFNLFYPIISQIEYIDPERVSRWQFVPLGIFIAHLTTIANFFFSRPYCPEEVENAIKMIEDSNLSKTEKRQQYSELIKVIIERVALNKEMESKFEEIQKEVQRQIETYESPKPAKERA